MRERWYDQRVGLGADVAELGIDAVDQLARPNRRAAVAERRALVLVGNRLTAPGSAGEEHALAQWLENILSVIGAACASSRWHDDAERKASRSPLPDLFLPLPLVPGY